MLGKTFKLVSLASCRRRIEATDGLGDLLGKPQEDDHQHYRRQSHQRPRSDKAAEHRCPAQCRQVVDQHIAERNDRAEVHTENHGVDQVEPNTTV